MAERIPQSKTIRVQFPAYLASDHISNATGKTIVIKISKNGGAFGNPSGGATNATEVASGDYYVDLTTTDTGTLGPLVVQGTVATVDDVKVYFHVTRDEDLVLYRDFAAAVTLAGSDPPKRSLMNSARQDVNHVDTTSVAGQIIVTKEDDSTEAYRKAYTSDPTAQLLTSQGGAS